MTVSLLQQDWDDTAVAVCHLLDGVQVQHWTRPTPCAEFDVRRLAGHLIGTARRTLATAEGNSTDRTPHVVTAVDDDEVASTYRELVERSGEAWARRDDADPVHAPWGPCTTAEALRGFTVETVVHGWDLAVATGQPSCDLDGVAGRCAKPLESIVPARLRGVMYDPERRAPADASPTELLAAALGRDVEAWLVR